MRKYGCFVVICLLYVTGVFAVYKCKKIEKDDENFDLANTGKEAYIGKPSKYGNYSLKVTNSGPAVIDSVISFLAVLTPYTGQSKSKSLFKYIWQNDADYDIRESHSNWTSNITSYMFDREVVLPNKYRMTVCVYEREVNPRGKLKMALVASGFTVFEMTETFNGREHIKQKTNYTRVQDFYATGTNVTYSINLTDRFPTDMKPSFVFHWTVCGKSLKKGAFNSIQFVYNKTGSCQIKCKVTADGYDTEGTWQRNVTFQDEVKSVNFSVSDQVISTGKAFIINVTYAGSNTTFCWGLEPISNSSYHRNQTCEMSSQTWHSIPINILEQGVYRMVVHISNNVSSVRELSEELYVSDPFIPYPESSSTSQAAPIVISLIGLIVIVAFVVYLVRVNKKRDVEVADFDFHPNLHEPRTIRSRLSSILNTAKGMFGSRDTYEQEHTHPSYRSTTARSYGTMRESNVIL